MVTMVQDHSTRHIGKNTRSARYSGSGGQARPFDGEVDRSSIISDGIKSIIAGIYGAVFFSASLACLPLHVYLDLETD